MAAKRGKKQGAGSARRAGARRSKCRALVPVAVQAERIGEEEPEDRRGLPDDIKRRIVIELATFHTPPEVRDMLSEEYELEVSVQDINRYDASKDYCVLGEPLRKLFKETREAFVAGTADLHIAERVFRLRLLQRMALRAESAGKLELAASLLEQGAKDLGGAFTNKREVSGIVGHVDMTPAQARAEIERFMAKAKTPAT